MAPDLIVFCLDEFQSHLGWSRMDQRLILLYTGDSQIDPLVSSFSIKWSRTNLVLAVLYPDDSQLK